MLQDCNGGNESYQRNDKFDVQTWWSTSCIFFQWLPKNGEGRARSLLDVVKHQVGSYRKTDWRESTVMGKKKLNFIAFSSL